MSPDALPPGRPDGAPWTRTVAVPGGRRRRSQTCGRPARRRAIIAGHVPAAMVGGVGGSGGTGRSAPSTATRCTPPRPRSGGRCRRAPVARLVPGGHAGPAPRRVLRSPRAVDLLRPEVCAARPTAGVPGGQRVAGSRGRGRGRGGRARVVRSVGHRAPSWSTRPAPLVAAARRRRRWGDAALGLARLLARGRRRRATRRGRRARRRGRAADGQPSPASPAPSSRRAGAGHAGRLVVDADPRRRALRRPPPRGLRVVANRGANGIDGVVSTAVGVAAGAGARRAADRRRRLPPRQQRPARGRRPGDRPVCVVVDNDGGGIFSFLPQARRSPPTGSRRCSARPTASTSWRSPRPTASQARRLGRRRGRDGGRGRRRRPGGVQVLVVRTDRTANVDVHRRVDDAVAAAVEAALAG